MLDTLATARSLADAGIEPAHADAITAAIRDAGGSADTVTHAELRADLAAMESLLTWRFNGIVLAQTGALLAAIIGTAITVVRMLGS